MRTVYRILLTITFLMIAAGAYAGAITAEGYGATEAEARANAASELSFIMYSDVRSELRTYMSDRKDAPEQSVSKQVDITSSIPIFAVDYKVVPAGSEYRCTVVMSPERALKAYRESADESVSKINSLYKSYNRAETSTSKYRAMSALIAEYENFRKLKGVLNILGGGYKNFPEITSEKALEILDGVTESVDSMSLAAGLIMQDIDKSRVYVHYPVYSQSDEVTQFGMVMRDMLVAAGSAVSDINEADYVIETEYSLADSGMYISTTAYDKQGRAVGKSVKMLAQSAYAGMDVKPKSVSFEKLLKLGMSISSDFTARLSTRNGKKAMLYKLSETVELFVKLSRPGYFFIVGHVDKADEKFSYIVDFYSAHGNRKFIRHIDADEINRWVSIGEFDIVPPFGLETFQLLATIKDPVGVIPHTVFDPETELYIISKDISEGVVKTRALKKKKENIDASAEDVLIFSTIEK